MVKDRVTLTIDRDLLKAIEHLREKRFAGVGSRSAIIEYYLRKGIEDDLRKIREEEIKSYGRVIT